MMKTVQNGSRKIRVMAARLHSRPVGLLAFGLVIAALMVACSGGSTPAGQSANAQAASQAGAPAPEQSQAEAAATEEGKARLPNTKEFGLTEEELVKSIEAVESRIAECMNEAGFEYVPVDAATVREAMDADKSPGGVGELEYAANFGYGISTQLDMANAPPQLAGPTTVVQIGLGEQNIQIFKNLSEADQEAYNHTLFGENTDATFAASLEAEDFSETGGCTRKAIEQVFNPDQLSAAYYNPGDALVEQDKRVIAAIAAWSDCMRAAGFDYNTPEEPEPDIEARLEAILAGAEPEELSEAAQAELIELQGEERAIAVAHLECEAKFITPVVQQVETELYGSPRQ